MPIGGASAVGASATSTAAAVRALTRLEGQLDWVVVADGSGGTHAGLLAGLPPSVRVLGVDVGTRPDLDEQVPAKAAEAAAHAGLPAPEGVVLIDHERFGSGYAAPTDDCRRALDLAARYEGLILDPVYTGKAPPARGTPGARFIAHDARVVFLHTGGLPALFAASYANWVKRGSWAEA